MPLLALDCVSVSVHGTPILSEISFQLEAGQTLGIIGESGSGKSMAALSIMQLLPHGGTLQGDIHFNGQSLDTLSEAQLCDLRGSDIGMIFQEPMTALNPVKTIGEQVGESIRLHTKVNAGMAQELTAQTLERVGLPNAEFPLGRYPHELSGGQRQRVVIAIAIACKPKLLIADEPTTALDVTTQAGILDLLKTLQREEGLALMLITHDLAVVSNMADDVVVMRQGQVVEQGNLSKVFRHPTKAYTRALFDASALTQINRSDSQPATLADGLSEKEIPLLQVNNLICEYRAPRASFFQAPTGFRAVDDISFEIRHGESVGLVGESGCGKSTLSRALLGLMTLHSGSILMNGELINNTKAVSRSVRQQMQVVFQDPFGSFNPRQRVGRLVSEPLFLLNHKPSKANALMLVSDVLESVGLKHSDANKFIHEFSGGQRQRIAIARALIIKPSLIILDEAVSALDVCVRVQVLELLDELARKEGLSYLFISHDLSVVQRVCDRVLVMKKGKIVEHGDTLTVFTQPRHPYTQQLIAAVPKLSIPD